VSKKSSDVVSRYLVLGIASLVAIFVFGAILLNNRPRAVDQELMDLIQGLPKGVTAEGLPYLGEADAPVTMIIYEDLACPHCRNFYFEVEPDVLRDYVATGQVKMVIYIIAIVSQQSLPGAEGVACAQDQDMFWEYRDALYNNQGVRLYNRENMTAIAGELGLDEDIFSRCFDFSQHTQEVSDRSQAAFQFGIQSTPTTEVLGVRYPGELPFDREAAEGVLPGIKQILEAALLEAGV